MAPPPTVDYVRTLFDAVGENKWDYLIAAYDPNLRWMVTSETRSIESRTGIYSLEEWTEVLVKPLMSRLKDQTVRFNILNIDIIGYKAIVECTGEATQLNGHPYNNRYAVFMTFSKETGKVIEVREYLDTALVQEVIRTN